ncbi:MAG: SEL1-like repeat protein [Firmicutes bacterium]|nr:SEL1-like repeat protein [Bacillota bacterium]
MGLTNEENLKIKSNRNENKKFKKQIDKYINGNLPVQATLDVCSLPNVLVALGSRANKVIMTQSTLQNAINSEGIVKKGHTKGHNIPLETIETLPDQMRNPILICEGSQGNGNNSLVMITELKDRNDKTIIVPLSLDIRGSDSIVCKINSIYGKNNLQNYLQNAINNNKIIAINEEKANRLFTDIGCQSSKSTSAICFDNSIAYSMKSVKYPNEILQENTRSESKTMEENTPYNLISIEIGGDVYHYRDNSENSVRDTLQNYDKSDIKVNGEFTQNFERISEIEYAEYEQSSNPPRFSMEINADENSLKLFRGEQLYSLSLSETLNSPNGRSDTQAAENIQTSTISPEVLKEVISDLSAPPTQKIDMMVNPKFDYVISSDKFAEINAAVYGNENRQAELQSNEEIAATKEDIQMNENEQDNTKKKEEELDEATNELLHKIRYTDIAEVNAEVIENIENNSIEEYIQPQTNEEITEETDIISSLHQAADERNDGTAQNILGVCYYTGTTVALDEQKGIEYFEKAAEQENPSAMRNLAIVLETREPIDLKRSVELYQKSADKNDAFAQNNLGVCYLLGDGVDRNIRKALQYFEKAAKSGDDYAMVNLADLYATGNGVRKNDKKAYEFYLQAAEKGNADGLKAAADCLLNGIGVKQDSQQALNFYKMAAEKGDMEAQNAYDKLEAKLSPKKHEVSVDETQKDVGKAENKSTKKRDPHSL